jgi:hypothetical protein
LTGLVFSVAAHAAWHWALLVSLPFLLFSGYRLAGTAEAWADAETRSRVVATVAS